MQKFRRIVLLVTVLVLLLPAVLLPARAAEQDIKPLIRQLLAYYVHYQDEAAWDIENILTQMEAIDPNQADTWRKLMDNWRWTSQEMSVNMLAFPENMPQDDSLCIVIMGYDLADSGAMRQELIDRLTIGLSLAQKYPNAYVACTGGATAAKPGVTEAGQMAAWLKRNGVAEERLIVERKAMSTTENALNVYAMLCAQYPQVRSVAIVTSDYHIRRSCLMFNTVSIYKAGYDGTPLIEVVGNAVCAVDRVIEEDYSLQAQGIAIVAGVELTDMAVPSLTPTVPAEPVEETQGEVPMPRTQTEPVQTDMPQQESMQEDIRKPETERKVKGLLPVIVALLSAGTVGILLVNRKKKSGS